MTYVRSSFWFNSPQELADMINLLHGNAKASAVLSRDDLRAITALTEHAKQFLDSRYEQFVRADSSGALMQIYSNDGTPVKTKVHVAATLTSDTCASKKLHLKQHQGIELLVQASFCRRRVGGELDTCATFNDPTPLSFGKTCEAIFATSLRSFSSLRSFGHQGIALEVKVFDRGTFSKLSNLFQRNHFRQSLNLPVLDGEYKMLLYLCEWCIAIPCALHDAQNAQKWGLHHWYNDAALLKDVHIGIESLRNSYDLLLTHLPGFLTRYVKFVHADEIPSANTLRQLWELLDMHAVALDILVKYRAIFREGHLLISDEFAHDSDLLGNLSSALIAMWRFFQFTDSR